MSVDLRKLIKEYLQEAKLMQVATSMNNQPWACSVYFAYDDKWNLYWISRSTRRHSQEIKNNEKVAGTIVLLHKHGDKVRGLQFQGVAKALTKEEIPLAMKIYAKRFHDVSKEKIHAIVEGKDSHFCYRISPRLFVLFDEVNFPDNPRQELNT